MKAEELVKLLKEKKYKIVSAESCTGGLFASTLIDIPSASSVLEESYVTYSQEAKIKICGVKEETITKNGIVSEEVAFEMANGIAKRTNSNIGVGITGYAGPTGGTIEKPVGTVCFGFYINGKTYTYTRLFKGNRNQIRRKSVNFAIIMLLKLI